MIEIVDPGRSEPTLDQTRILLVIGHLGLGGAERQALVLARELIQRHGARVEVWAFHGPGPSPQVWEEYGIPWRVVRLPWARKRVRRIRRLVQFGWKLRHARPDVILSFTLYPNVACGLTWRWSGAKAYLWGQRDALERIHDSNLDRLAARWSRSFTSNSEHAREFMDRNFGIPRERVVVIRNGVDMPPPKQSRRAWRSRLGVDEGCFTACMLAHIMPRKDHAPLIRAWRIVVDRLARRNVRAVLVLAGGSPEKVHHLHALVSELELEDHVRFTGFVDDVSGLLTAIDAGVFSSRTEGCPNGVLECMDAGLAVAATDIPGIREALGPDGLPFLAPPGDEKKLAEVILDLAENPALRASVGAANRERIRKEFTVQEKAAQYAAAIRRELSGSGR